MRSISLLYVLGSADYDDFLRDLYGDKPARWTLIIIAAVFVVIFVLRAIKRPVKSIEHDDRAPAIEDLVFGEVRDVAFTQANDEKVMDLRIAMLDDRQQTVQTLGVRMRGIEFSGNINKGETVGIPREAVRVGETTSVPWILNKTTGVYVRTKRLPSATGCLKVLVGLVLLAAFAFLFFSTSGHKL